jgi:hypothetical protein
VLSNNAFSEALLKLPALFTHYYHHAQEEKDTTNVLDFFKKHYIESNTNQNHEEHQDEDADCELPFKHCGHCCLTAHSPVIGFIPSYLDTNYLPSEIQKQNFQLENEKIESLELHSIWQPPKLI